MTQSRKARFGWDRAYTSIKRNGYVVRHKLGNCGGLGVPWNDNRGKRHWLLLVNMVQHLYFRRLRDLKTYVRKNAGKFARVEWRRV